MQALVQFGLIGGMVGIMYFVMIRPQQKKLRLHEAFVRSLKVGDEVVTNTGLFGTITDIEETVIHLAIDTDVIIRVQRGAIAGLEHPTETVEEDS